MSFLLKTCLGFHSFSNLGAQLQGTVPVKLLSKQSEFGQATCIEEAHIFIGTVLWFLFYIQNGRFLQSFSFDQLPIRDSSTCFSCTIVSYFLTAFLLPSHRLKTSGFLKALLNLREERKGPRVTWDEAKVLCFSSHEVNFRAIWKWNFGNNTESRQFLIPQSWWEYLTKLSTLQKQLHVSNAATELRTFHLRGIPVLKPHTLGDHENWKKYADELYVSVIWWNEKFVNRLKSGQRSTLEGSCSICKNWNLKSGLCNWFY